MRPLSHMKKRDYSSRPESQQLRNSMEIQAQKDFFKKGILNKIKEHEVREEQYLKSQNAVNVLLN